MERGSVSRQSFIAWMQLGLMGLLAMVVFPEATIQGTAYIRLGAAAVEPMLLLALVFRYT